MKFSILVFKIWLTLYYSIIYSDLILMEKDVKGAIFEICFWTYVGMIINVHVYYAKCLCTVLFYELIRKKMLTNLKGFFCWWLESYNDKY